MISNLRISLVELVIWAVLAMVGLAWTLARVFDGLERARDWWIDRRDSRESGVPVSGFRRLREWTRDRVTPLLEEEPGEPELLHEWHDHAPLGYHDEAVRGCPACEMRWELPPERTWEQMTSHQYPLTVEQQMRYELDRVADEQRAEYEARHAPERERRPPAYETEARAHYEAMGFDYPSGLMARVRELTP